MKQANPPNFLCKHATLINTKSSRLCDRCNISTDNTRGGLNLVPIRYNKSSSSHDSKLLIISYNLRQFVVMTSLFVRHSALGRVSVPRRSIVCPLSSTCDFFYLYYLHIYNILVFGFDDIYVENYQRNLPEIINLFIVILFII